MMKFAALALVACGSASPRSAGLTVQPGDLVIDNVTAVSGDVEVPHRTIVIRGERIVEIGSVGTFDTTGARVIDGKGKWLMPGLADMHVHTWRDADLTMFIAAGVTTIRNMWGIPMHVTWRDEIARGARFGPTIVTSGALIDGDPPAWPGSVVLDDPAAADALVQQEQREGYDFLKVVNKLSRESYDALVAAAARHHRTIAGHVTYAVGLGGVLAAHQRSVEHLDGYLQALVPPGVTVPPLDQADAWMSTMLEHVDFALLPAEIERTKAAGTWNCPTLIGNDHIAELYDLATITKHVAWRDLVQGAQLARWERDFDGHHGSPEETKRNRDLNAMFSKVAAELVRAGAPILVGTDSGLPYDVPGEGLHDEIELLVQAGIPRARVVRAATADAQRFLGHADEGVITRGARADLLLVSVDPFAQPLPLVPDVVIVRGHTYSHDELTAKLDDVRAHTGPPADPWRGHPDLPGATTYAIMVRSSQVGAERVVKHLAQLVDFGGGVDADVVLDDRLAVHARQHGFEMELVGERSKASYSVGGHDLSHRPVKEVKAVPAGAVVVTSEILGGIKLAAAAVAGAHTIHALEVRYADSPVVVEHHYKVTHKTNRLRSEGLHVFELVDQDQTVELVTNAKTGDVVAMTRDGQTWLLR